MSDIIDWTIRLITTPWVWITLVVHLTVLGTVAYLILLERKTASWVQDRIGPNRVGLGFGIIPFLKDKKMFGLGQPLADGVKFILKEDYQPKNVDRYLFTAAPMIFIIVIIISIAVIPWGGIKQSTKTVALPAAVDPAAVTVVDNEVRNDDGVVESKIPFGVRVVDVRPAGSAQAVEVTYRYAFQIADLNIGVLFVLAALSLAVYGVVVGGWASNNKYSFIGGLRATANMISYEIPLGLSVLAIVIMFGTLDLNLIVNRQVGYWGFIPAWNIFTQPLAFLMFLICIHAEANRAPFDTAEAEQELVGGYHTEYSAMRFALFFLAEYAGMITTSAVCVALFFGGWHLPGLGGSVDPTDPGVTESFILCVIRGMVFFGKTLAIVFVFMWVRWSLPRFRFDQIMMLAWRGLIPIALVQLMITAVVLYLLPPRFAPNVEDGNRILPFGTALALLVANGVLLVGAMLVSRMLPPAPETNRKMGVANSRYRRTPLPGRPVVALAVNREAREGLPVGRPEQSGRMGA